MVSLDASSPCNLMVEAASACMLYHLRECHAASEGLADRDEVPADSDLGTNRRSMLKIGIESRLTINWKKPVNWSLMSQNNPNYIAP